MTKYCRCLFISLGTVSSPSKSQAVILTIFFSAQVREVINNMTDSTHYRRHRQGFLYQAFVNPIQAIPQVAPQPYRVPPPVFIGPDEKFRVVNELECLLTINNSPSGKSNGVALFNAFKPNLLGLKLRLLLGLKRPFRGAGPGLCCLSWPIT